MPAPSANFTIEYEGPDAVVLRDLGPWHRHRTITSDAEAVVAYVAPQLGARRLFYVDSEGRIDELLVCDGRFNGFRAGAPDAVKEVVGV